MKRKSKKSLYGSIFLIATFLVWTVAVKVIDVKAIGPQNSEVGFATINQFMHELSDVHMDLYFITDILSIIPLSIVAVFAISGFIQLIVRKSLFKVDRSIIILGVFYAVVISVYVLFEIIVINHRPILIEGVLEASYPSSTTMLAMCVMPAASIHLNSYIKKLRFRRIISFASIAFTVFMVVARFISGVHWFSDIIGGILISSGLVTMYYYILHSKTK